VNAPNESDLLAADVASNSRRNFSILDFMLATMAFAVALGLLQEPPIHLPKAAFWQALFYWERVVFHTLVIFGVLLLLRGKGNRNLVNATSERWWPGHLMLIMATLELLPRFVDTIVFWVTGDLNQMPVDSSQHSALRAARNSSYRAVILLPFVIVVLGLVMGSMRRWWIATFVVIGMWQLLVFSTYLWSEEAMYGGSVQLRQWITRTQIIRCVSILFVFIAVGADLRLTLRRDTAHWIGIICFIQGILVPSILFGFAR